MEGEDEMNSEHPGLSAYMQGFKPLEEWSKPQLFVIFSDLSYKRMMFHMAQASLAIPSMIISKSSHSPSS